MFAGGYKGTLWICMTLAIINEPCTLDPIRSWEVDRDARDTVTYNDKSWPSAIDLTSLVLRSCALSSPLTNSNFRKCPSLANSRRRETVYLLPCPRPRRSISILANKNCQLDRVGRNGRREMTFGIVHFCDLVEVEKFFFLQRKDSLFSFRVSITRSKVYRKERRANTWRYQYHQPFPKPLFR